MKEQLSQASHLVQYPIAWIPETKDQAKAALIGFNLSDGTITQRGPLKYSAGFYGEREGLVIAAEAFNKAYGVKPNIGFKKGGRKEFDSWQIQIGGDVASDLVSLGAVVGKKVEQNYEVPEWIRNHDDVEVRRAFMAALWGAEGSSPSRQHKTLRMPVLSMHKRSEYSFEGFFEQIKAIMLEIGVSTTTRSAASHSGRAHRMYVNAGTQNLISFLEKCGYLFCARKARLAWLWAKYLRAMQYDATTRRERALEAFARLGMYSKAGDELGITRGAVHALIKRNPSNPRPALNFPCFEEWVKGREHNGGLMLRITERAVGETVQMFNVLVSSPDHSYLLADGTDNFNSFETAAGRIYDDYGDANLTDATIQPHEALHWSHDQNYTPLSSCIAVIRDGIPYLLDEIVLTSAISRQSAQEFVERYRDHKNKVVYIYGDPHGRAGEKHGHKSDYSEIEQVLRDNGWRYENRVSRSAPAIKDRQNAVRALIRSASGDVRLRVNKAKAPWCHRGLGTVQVKQGSAFLEDDKNQYQHITTAIGYFSYRLWPTIREAMAIKMGMAQ